MNGLTIKLIILALWLALTFNLVSKNLKRVGFIQAYSTYSSLYRKLFIPVVYAAYAVSNALIPPIIFGFLPKEFTNPLLFFYVFSCFPVFFVLLDFELHFPNKVQEKHLLDYPNERVIRIFMLEQIESEIDSEILDRLEKLSSLSESDESSTPTTFVNLIPLPREKAAVLLFAHSNNYLKLYHQHAETSDEIEKLEESRQELINVMETIDTQKPDSKHKYIYVNNDKEEVEKFGLYVIPFSEWDDIQKVPTASENIWKKTDIIDLLEN